MEKQNRETPLHFPMTSNLEVKVVWKGPRAQMTSKWSARLHLGHLYWRMSLFNKRHIITCTHTQDVFSPNSLDRTVNFRWRRDCCCISSIRLFAFAPCCNTLIMMGGETKGGRNHIGLYTKQNIFREELATSDWKYSSHAPLQLIIEFFRQICVHQIYF